MLSCKVKYPWTCQPIESILDHSVTHIAPKAMFCTRRSAYFLVSVFVLAPFTTAFPQLVSELASIPASVEKDRLPKTLNPRIQPSLFKAQAFALPTGLRFSPENDTCVAESIHFQQRINGRLESVDCILETGQYFDVYYFEALAGEQVDIHMYENWFDTVLFLGNESGTWVVSDDDSGGNQAARILAKVPETGIYFIIATSYQAAASSNYNVILRGGPVCTYDITPSSAVVPPEGGTFTYAVKTPPRCYFQARAGDMYVDSNSLTASGQGLGNGLVTYTVTPNPRNQQRIGGIGVAPYPIQANHNVTQLPKVCTYTFDPPSPLMVGPFETTGNITVQSQPGCQWSAVGGFEAHGSSLNGNGVVAYKIYHNNGPARSGPIRIDTAIYDVQQQGLNCTYSIAPNNERRVSGRGTEGILNITTQANCTWGLSKSQNWIEMQPALYQGSRSIPFRIPPVTENDDRSGSIGFGYSFGWSGGPATYIHIDQLPNLFTASSDFDGDGISDVSTFDPVSGGWRAQGSLRTVSDATLGTAGEKVVAADYDGDGKTDPALFSPSTGNWKILKSSNGQVTEFKLGTNGDIPIPEDYDGDGKADPAVYRPSDSRWFINKSLSGPSEVVFGSVNSLPVPADWNNDGKAEPAVFNRETSKWELSTSLNGPMTISFGTPEDYIFVADYGGSGFLNPSYYRPATGEWRVRNLPYGDQYTVSVPFVPGGVPVIGDFNGDGRTDPAIYDPATGNWNIQFFIANSSKTANFGGAGVIPLSGLVHAPSVPSHELSGRVVAPDGRGLRNVFVSLVSENSIISTISTSSLGYFSFENLPKGEYTLRAASRRYRFDTSAISLNGSLTNLIITGIE